MAKFLNGSTRQLTDLTQQPSKTDARPLFDLGQIPPDYPGYGELPPYRCLRWHPVTGAEVCATTLEQVARYDEDGYLSHPMQVAPKSAVEDVATELESLSAEDRAIVFAAQRKSRLDALQARMSKLSDAELSAVSSGTVPVKRGPGRPRKTDG